MTTRPTDPHGEPGPAVAGDPGAGDDVEDWFAREEQLTLAGEDERLPWLESDEDYEDGGFDMVRLVTVASIGLMVVLALLGGLWWFTQTGSDDELLAEGSTIEAPAEPFRVRPDNPGGMEVAGTGDVSFEVGQGQAPDAVLEEDAALPRPSIDRDPGSEDSAVPAAPATASATSAAGSAPAATGGVGVQVAAFTSRARAEEGWRDLSRRYEVLDGRSHRVVQASVDGATVYRLQVVADSVGGADSLCRALKAAGGDCQVMR